MPVRVDGYAPIGDYAVIGNKRTAALVARDGSIDWLCLPSLAGPSVFAALLDSDGGSFALAPTSFVAQSGDVAIVALSAFHREPLRVSTRELLLAALDATAERWRRWIASCDHDGPWRAAVRRNALALDLLVDDETGAVAGTATVGLPERIGGPRNFDYRYTWLRDSNLTLEAMLRLGFGDQVHTSLAWTLRTIAHTHPRLRPMYQLDGGVRLPDEQLALCGYRDSRPVLLGNGAQDQFQLGNYGDLFDMTLRYVEHGGALGRRPPSAWPRWPTSCAGSGAWRTRASGSFTTRATTRRASSRPGWPWIARSRWRGAAHCPIAPRRPDGASRRRCAATWWSAAGRQSSAATRAPPAQTSLRPGILLAGRGSFLQDDRERLGATIDAITRELGAGGPLLYRYSGMQEQEGAFLACSFWMVEAMVGAGRVGEAVERMDALVALASDVGLYSEQIDPSSGALLGNLPQALSISRS